MPHLSREVTMEVSYCSRCEAERAEVGGQLAAVVWAELTARAQQAREDVASAIDRADDSCRNPSSDNRRGDRPDDSGAQ